MIQVFSSGGGTQSSAIAALIIQGKLPRPDFIVIADTGREAPSTWEYMDSVVAPALDKIGLVVHRVGPQWVSDSASGVFHASGSLLIPAFSNQTGNPSKLSNFCTNEWKVRPIERWLKRVHGVKKGSWVKWIGFSFDEPRRYNRMMEGKDYKAGLVRFPLVELRLKRQDAIQSVIDMGWPTPPRSRCYMCPNQSDSEWAEVKNRWPAKYEAALTLDSVIRISDPHAFLHSKIKPLAAADLTKPDDLFSGSCPNGECFI
jgi:hypothetical protein